MSPQGRTPDLERVTPLDEYELDDDEVGDYKKLVDEAASYIRSFKWCGGIAEMYAGIVLPGVFGVFLVKIVPAGPNVDEWLWVIVGDLPPAYIVLDEAPNPATGLDAYIGAMQEWVEALEKGHSTQGLIPVNVEPTPEWAEDLKRRLEFLAQRVLPEYAEDLKER